mmetsp:Transcript_22188/g.33883  ORF Transcript_22188/g.33883 Transcript_22188/m.33883 type:complete len:566 (-) Transcript_22188:509-2206(-)|eukprot:CAMPEP_0196815754 /NCGR_PEP_ID=MMETSP1362-20130617/51722_1 /TAXON_ID=163516 /ORGANISM="Leptocylindrus danicus, Strain CCMP1856" /LENGTH=565 /DNA_ID=CAMNT_0042192843 /DNA_START=114 /DNA_END=1811 /DNA_ORIENTATION=-
MYQQQMRWYEPLPNTNQQNPPIITTPTIKNHSVTYHENYLYCFGGYDGRRNHSSLVIFDIVNRVWFDGDGMLRGASPPGRNGHTATLADGKIIIIGGWLGSGPLAASDLYVLDVSNGPDNLRWFQPVIKGEPPGPCNMHSADYVELMNEVYVFRGGNGREYLNDLHALHTDTYEWRLVETTGSAPQQRANHSSAVLNETGELFIFGGWNGRERLNDIHILDVRTSTWSSPHVGGVVPQARAGMTLTALRDRLYLFGGSGTSSKCFDDLQILDRQEMTWLDVSAEECRNASRSRPSHYIKSERARDSDFDSEDDFKDATWRMQGLQLEQQSNANPNDEAVVQSIAVVGHGPGKRAGHTATAVNRNIYIFGGSCGSDYLNDFFVLDTDPPPVVAAYKPTTLQLFERRLKDFFNDEEFSDVIFLVEGRRVYGHRMVLSLVSDCFRAMFTSSNGFREASEEEIEIPQCSYTAFMQMMEYIYTGKEPKIEIAVDNITEGISKSINEAVELLELADQFFLDHLKQVCECILQPAVNTHTFEELIRVAQKTNAVQLEMICRHFERNQDNIVE